MIDISRTNSHSVSEIFLSVGKYIPIPTWLLEGSAVTSMASQSWSEEKKTMLIETLIQKQFHTFGAHKVYKT